MSDFGSSRYVEGAVVGGVSAHVLARVLASPSVARVLVQLPPWMREELEETRRAIVRAAAAYEALPVAEPGTTATDEAEAASAWPHEIDTREAATLLGLGERRVRQLAAGGMGRRVGGRWVFDQALVRAHAAHRGRAA